MNDTGSGIDEQTLKNLFLVGDTNTNEIDSSLRTKGAHLGLTISYNLSKKLGC